MEEHTYDPDDQFFAAFKAGYRAGLSSRQRRHLDYLAEQVPDLDEAFWKMYVGWLEVIHGDAVR